MHMCNTSTDSWYLLAQLLRNDVEESVFASQILTIQSGLGGRYRITPIRDPNAVDAHKNH